MDDDYEDDFETYEDDFEVGKRPHSKAKSSPKLRLVWSAERRRKPWVTKFELLFAQSKTLSESPGAAGWILPLSQCLTPLALHTVGSHTAPSCHVVSAIYRHSFL